VTPLARSCWRAWRAASWASSAPVAGWALVDVGGERRVSLTPRRRARTRPRCPSRPVPTGRLLMRSCALAPCPGARRATRGEPPAAAEHPRALHPAGHRRTRRSRLASSSGANRAGPPPNGDDAVLYARGLDPDRHHHGARERPDTTPKPRIAPALGLRQRGPLPDVSTSLAGGRRHITLHQREDR
jgi:hypothetical protein